jgi:site-specific DNA-methyltransferase (adenine-specific)
MKDISANSIDLIICDLPYGCLTTGNNTRKRFIDGKDTGTTITHETIGGCAWDIPIDLEAFWKEVKRIRRKEHSPCIHFCTTKFGYELIKSNEKEFRYDLVWDKQRGVSFLSANRMPMRSHEMVYVFSSAGAYYNRVDISGDFKSWKVKKEGLLSVQSTQYSGAKRTDTEGGDGKRCVLSVIPEMGGNRKTNGHPTEKPVELYKFLIERYCPVGGTVLDPTFGSCNSGRASEELHRNYIGIEKDETFYKKAVKSLIEEE